MSSQPGGVEIMPIQEVRVTNLPHVNDPRGDSLLHTIKTFLGIHSIDRIATARVYRFEGISETDAELLAQSLLAEDVFQRYTLNEPIIEVRGHTSCEGMSPINEAAVLVEVAYKPGVMNPEAIRADVQHLVLMINYRLLRCKI